MALEYSNTKITCCCATKIVLEVLDMHLSFGNSTEHQNMATNPLTTALLFRQRKQKVSGKLATSCSKALMP